MLNMTLGVRTLRSFGQDQLVRSGNYCCSSIRVASIDENKNYLWKITMTHTQTTFSQVKKGRVLLGWSPDLSVRKISYRAQTAKITKCKHTIQIATFNVRTLNRIGQLQELPASALEHKIPFTKTIQIRQTRHAGHCWRSRNDLISNVPLWTPSHGRAKAGQPARTYIQHLCEDTGCSPEDLPDW